MNFRNFCVFAASAAAAWYFFAPSPEAWLKETCKQEREKLIGKTWGPVRCKDVRQGPGKRIAYDYTVGYDSSQFDPAFETRIRSYFDGNEEFQTKLEDYRSRKIAVEFNLFSSDDKMVASHKY